MFDIHILKRNQWGAIFNDYWQTVPSFNNSQAKEVSPNISRLHSVELRFILHVENLVSRWAVSTDLVNHVPSFTLSCLWRIFKWSSWPLLVDQGMRYYGGLKSSSKFIFEHSQTANNIYWTLGTRNRSKTQRTQFFHKLYYYNNNENVIKIIPIFIIFYCNTV